MMDMADQELEIGNIVAFSHQNEVWIGRISKMTKKKIVIRYRFYLDDDNTQYTDETTKFPETVFRVEGENLLAYILRKGI